MEALTKNQILKKTHCRFFVWTPEINALEVTKKSLRSSLKNLPYSTEFTVRGIYESGSNKGQEFSTLVIML